MSPRAMSIGEVLSTLKGDYPDVSVSKIRFLESEGLIRPERTASGYRKFAATDLERLRAILKMQRDSFLPLKVIRERLAAMDAGTLPPEPIAAVAAKVAPVDPGAPEPDPAPVTRVEGTDLTEPTPNVRLAEGEFAGATGLDLEQVRALREFGVICEHTNGAGAYFDGDDVAIGTLAVRFLLLGIEPRHLKQLRRFAEQEAAMFEQLVTPAIRTRRPEAKDQAAGTLSELATLSHALRHTYVRQSLRAVISGDR